MIRIRIFIKGPIWIRKKAEPYSTKPKSTKFSSIKFFKRKKTLTSEMNFSVEFKLQFKV